MPARVTPAPHLVRTSFWQRLSGPQLIAVTFGLAILIGAVLLWLPVTHEAGKTLSFIQALFMATSAVLSAALVLVGFTLMLYFNTNVNLKFHQLLFETVSAFATVGLSMDTTPLLNANQELVLIALMFFGRIGPLTFAVAFAQRRAARLVQYPAERDVLVG